MSSAMSSKGTFGLRHCYTRFHLGLVFKASRKAVAGLLVVALFSAWPAFAVGPCTVINNADSGAGSLREAIGVSACDPIQFQAGLASPITLGSELLITRDVTITGPGASSLAISGGGTTRVFEIGSGTTVAISGLTIKNGSADVGGGILNNGTLALSNSTLSGNSATSFGGGIFMIFHTLTLTNSTLSGNSATLSGGGIHSENGTLTLTNSTLSGNSAGSGGGGIANQHAATLTLTNSTLSGNSAGSATSTGFGGGIFNLSGTATLTNSTLSDNSVTSGGFGGGIYSDNVTLTLTNSTLSGNSAANGGGIYTFDGNSTLKNTLLAKGPSGGNCSVAFGGTVASQGHNLSDDGTCTSYLTQPGDLNSTLAGLDSGGLQNNGGPTKTIALLPTSPAVNAIIPASDCSVSTDQRGVTRPQGSACDIGAFELTTGPIVSGVTASPNPVAINAGSTLTANVDDSTTGGSNIASAGYNIDGGSFIPMIAADSVFDQVNENVIASVAPFTAAGLHTLCVLGTDAPGNIGPSQCIVLVVYDPTGGFVTGGGAINSPAGADLANTSAAGPATFGFVSKYLPGRSTPDGNLEFQFREGNLNFKSTMMDWLVVTGEPRGQFQGTGTINGTTVCKFAVDAWDASYSVSKVDAFGLRIFACGGASAEVHRYSLPATPLTKGSIIIHK